jgi:hypothetical protein
MTPEEAKILASQSGLFLEANAWLVVKDDDFRHHGDFVEDIRRPVPKVCAGTRIEWSTCVDKRIFVNHDSHAFALAEDPSVLLMTVTLITRLCTPELSAKDKWAAAASQKCNVVEKEMMKANLRRKMFLEVVMRNKEVPELAAKKLQFDLSYRHWCDWFEAFSATQHSLGSSISMLGQLEVDEPQTDGSFRPFPLRYAGTCDLLCAHVMPDETLARQVYLFKNGSEPSGIRALNEYIDGDYAGAFPDNKLARHVLHINLVMHAARTWPSHGVPTVLAPEHFLVYSTPNDRGCILRSVPVFPTLVLATLVYKAQVLVDTVRILERDPHAPRALLNAAFSFGPEREAFKRFPATVTHDIIVNVNGNGKPLNSCVGRTADGRNILAAQCLMENQQLRSHTWYYTCALRYFFGDTLRHITATRFDENPEQWRAMKIAIGRGTFHAETRLLACIYHKLLQSLDKPEVLGRGNIPPNVFTLIKHCLYDIAGYYETETEARQALAALDKFCHKYVPASRYANLRAFLGKLESTLDRWAFFKVKFVLTYLEWTSNRAEIENAILRGKKLQKVAGLGKKNKLHDSVTFTGGVLNTRHQKVQTGLYAQASLRPAGEASGRSEQKEQESEKDREAAEEDRGAAEEDAVAAGGDRPMEDHEPATAASDRAPEEGRGDAEEAAAAAGEHRPTDDHEDAAAAAESPTEQGRGDAATEDPFSSSLRDAQAWLVDKEYKTLQAVVKLVPNYEAKYNGPHAVGTWIVQRTPEALAAAVEAARKREKRKIGPTIFRPRLVYVAGHSDGLLYLRCTCGLHEQTLRLCAHILAVKKLLVVTDDVHFEKFWGYAAGAFTIPRAFDENVARGATLSGVDPVIISEIRAKYTGKIEGLERWVCLLPAPTIVAGIEDIADSPGDRAPAPATTSKYSDFMARMVVLAQGIADLVGHAHPDDPDGCYDRDVAVVEEAFATVIRTGIEANHRQERSAPRPGATVVDSYVPAHNTREERRTPSSGEARGKRRTRTEDEDIDIPLRRDPAL